jgi:hypothetical protein
MDRLLAWTMGVVVEPGLAVISMTIGTFVIRATGKLDGGGTCRAMVT